MLSSSIYRLRRERGLSQEQLAEAIGVSRQAISKWERGVAMPEAEKLLALSSFFQVSVEELLAGTSLPPEPQKDSQNGALDTRKTVGVCLCLAGVACLLLFGFLAVCFPAATERLEASSAVTLNGTGLLLLFCVLFIAAGAFLILRKK